MANEHKATIKDYVDKILAIMIFISQNDKKSSCLQEKLNNSACLYELIHSLIHIECPQIWTIIQSHYYSVRNNNSKISTEGG